MQELKQRLKCSEKTIFVFDWGCLQFGKGRCNDEGSRIYLLPIWGFFDTWGDCNPLFLNFPSQSDLDVYSLVCFTQRCFTISTPVFHISGFTFIYKNHSWHKPYSASIHNSAPDLYFIQQGKSAKKQNPQSSSKGKESHNIGTSNSSRPRKTLGSGHPLRKSITKQATQQIHP